jgi:Fur family ferric uptake transcriptional regulator
MIQCINSERWYRSSNSTGIQHVSSTRISTESIVETLSSHGHRITGPRRAVIDAVLEHDRPFTAEQIVAQVPSAGRATVYRTLELLASLDFCTRILQPGGHPAYVHGEPGHRHHLVCSGCGTTVSFTACPVDQIVDDLREATHFRIDGHHLEVFGACPDCSARPIDTMSH